MQTADGGKKGAEFGGVMEGWANPNDFQLGLDLMIGRFRLKEFHALAKAQKTSTFSSEL